QAADLHSNRPGQWLVLRQLEDPRRAARMADVAALYREKRDRFAESLARHMTGLAEWEVPRGGLFFWLRLRDGRGGPDLLARALDHGVAFMPGAPFFPEPPGGDMHIRLNFSHATASQAEEGLALLARLLERYVVNERKEAASRTRPPP